MRMTVLDAALRPSSVSAAEPLFSLIAVFTILPCNLLRWRCSWLLQIYLVAMWLSMSQIPLSLCEHLRAISEFILLVVLLYPWLISAHIVTLYFGRLIVSAVSLIVVSLLLLITFILCFEPLIEAIVCLELFLFLLGLFRSFFCHLLLQNQFLLCLFIQPVCHLFDWLQVGHFKPLELLVAKFVIHFSDLQLGNLVLS